MNETKSDLKVLSSRLDTLVGARFIAALIVVIYHSGSIISQPRFYGEHAFGGILTHFTGVSFFFVLSGFLLGWVNWKAIGTKKEGAWNFVSRRTARIFPSYWLVLIPLIILYQIFPSTGLDQQRDPINILCSIFLLPYPSHPVLGVAWTLKHEMLFCFLFAGIIWWGKKAVLLLPIWAAGILVANIFFSPLPFPLSFLFFPSNLQFLIGILTARLIKEAVVPTPLLLTFIGGASYLGFMLIGSYYLRDGLYDRIIYGISSALIIAGLVGWERSAKRNVPKLLATLGGASYSIYLIHPIVLSFGATLLFKFHARDWPVGLVIFTLTFFGILGGVLFDRFVEVPLSVYVRKTLFDKKDPGITRVP